MRIDAFSDELLKLGAGRTFPISRALTTPLSLVDALRGAVSGGTLGHTVGGPVGAGAGGVAGALYGVARGVGESLGRRRNFAQSTLARLRDGGAGLMQHEQARLAEGLGVSSDRLEKLVGGMKQQRRDAGAGRGEGEYSRFANSALNPIAALGRFLDARALAGRMGTRESLLADEKMLVDALRRRERIERAKDVAMPAAKVLGAAGAVGGAGYGAYRVHQERSGGSRPRR
jgi:hypothetical protein